jgi:hypothetical protein
MNKTYHYLNATLLLLFLVGGIAFGGAHDMLLKTTTTGYPYITSIIMGDTLTSGARADSARVYVIQRGTNWLFTNIIYNNGWDLNIKAQDSSGAKPIISGYVQSGLTTVPIEFINAAGNINIKNVVINGIYDLSGDTNYTKFYHSAPRELICYNSGSGFTMIVDSCVFMHGYQADLRTFVNLKTIKVTNCIFGNQGEEWVASLGNGRALDLRNAAVDTVVFTNNTVVNGYDRVIRHIASVGSLNNFTFEHNTVINNGGTYGVMALGQLKGSKVSIKNNLFVDAMAEGADTNLNRQSDFMEMGAEPFSSTIVTRINMPMIYNQKIDTISAPTFDIRNNYTYVTSAIQAAWTTMNSNGWDPIVKEASPLSNYIWSKVADSANAFKKLTTAPGFTNVPNPMSAMVLWHMDPAGANGSSSGSYYQDYDRRTAKYFRDTMSCVYTSSAAINGGTDGFNAGDLNWFPSQLEAWKLTGIVSNGITTPNKFVLSQNYPNPFNPSTVIKYQLTNTGLVTLKVYNVIGQEVATLVNSVLTAGSHEAKFDASRLSSGVYFYTLRSGSFAETKKMVLMK